MRRALGTTVLTSALILPLLAGTAHAESLTFPDAQGDSSSPSTDVVSYTVSNEPAEVVVTARLAAPNVDVLTGSYEFDVNGDGISDFDAFSTGPVFRLPGFTQACDAGASFRRATPDVVTLTVPASCLGAPTQVRVKFLLFGDAGSDFVPDAGTFSPTVSRTAAQPTVAPSPSATPAPASAPVPAPVPTFVLTPVPSLPATALPAPVTTTTAAAPAPVPAPTATAGGPVAGSQPIAPAAPTGAPAPLPTAPAATAPPAAPRPPAVVKQRLRVSATPATIRRGQQSRVCVRSSVGDRVNLYAYTAPSRTYRLVRSAVPSGTLQCWNMAPTADTRVYASPAGDTQRNSTSVVIRVVQPVRQAARPVAARPVARPAAPRPVARPTAPRPVAPARPSDVYYRNCDAARAAGAAPIRRGQPGYRPGLDRDNDGTACDRG